MEFRPHHGDNTCNDFEGSFVSSIQPKFGYTKTPVGECKVTQLSHEKISRVKKMPDYVCMHERDQIVIPLLSDTYK